ncbi:MBL fold metallo-hydrolase [Desulfovibrio ferrophilus]|uniref:Metallo-beta-lactamase family protein n=1 Tax=Desulfovibrio ferrophilus TaxID=241368 RepID=A0A2Z6AZF6_9BACT|nr:MBL fold metallo-hydrolase [Desulfovibrio ferrophilus]BBD08570.1 metallo-beta-lactamase family protein [Desulfovibrio ferrophilus]
MQVTVWGCRGSLPASTNVPLIRTKIVRALESAVKRGVDESTNIQDFIDRELPFSVWGSYGSNTTCVQIAAGSDEYLLVDAGSGLRDFGNRIIATKGPRPHVYNILMSHLHWDHLMGFPFFIPAYIPGNVIRFWGCHDQIEHVFRTQQSEPFFPVTFDDLGAQVEFNILEPGKAVELGGTTVTPFEQNHPGRSYGYRFEQDGKAFVMSTDSEHHEGADDADYPFLSHVRDADLMIFDAQYTFHAANTSKKDWGHSSNIVGVELAKRAGVKRICLFHQEPTLDDASIESFQRDTARYAQLFMPEAELEVLMAYDGLVVEL